MQPERSMTLQRLRGQKRGLLAGDGTESSSWNRMNSMPPEGLAVRRGNRGAPSVAFLLLLVLAACSTTAGGADTSAPQASREELPIELLWPGGPADRFTIAAQEILVGECMGEAGFDYWVDPDLLPAASSGPVSSWDESGAPNGAVRFGWDDVEQALETGYVPWTEGPSGDQSSEMARHPNNIY